MVLEQKVGLTEAAGDWTCRPRAWRTGCGSRAGKPLQARVVRPVSDLEADNARLRAENARLKMEREILRKAAAYFAKDAL